VSHVSLTDRAEAFRLYCYAARGEMTPAEALASYDEHLATLPARAIDGRHQVLYALACRVAAVHARWSDLGRLIGLALEIDPSSQFAFFGGQMLLYRSLLEATSGDLDAALVTCAEGTARYRAVGGRTGTATCHASLAEHLATAGRVIDAGRLAVAARTETVETGERVNEVPVRIAEAVVAHASGDRRLARDHFTAAVVTGEQQGAHGLARRAQAVAAELSVPL
jgi:hypothetical protein